MTIVINPQGRWHARGNFSRVDEYAFFVLSGVSDATSGR